MLEQNLIQKARTLMPRGVAENYRFWGDETIFIQQAKGAKLIDCNGKEYIDFRLGYGPIILGYGDARIDNAVIEQIKESGILYGFSSPLDLQVVEQMQKICPQLEMVRFANSGTEAVMGAVRTARSYTKKNHVAIVEGGFHGLCDEMMWRPDYENRIKNLLPLGSGLAPSSQNHISYISMNDDEELHSLFASKSHDLAAILMEPIIGNAGSISVQKPWLERLQKMCQQHGTLLIFDEVKTGFRVALGGAQQLYGMKADLSTYAKAMGNGYPIAAFGGRRDIMEIIGPHKGGVTHGGTYTANLIGMRAANKTLEILSKGLVYETIFSIGEKIKQTLSRVFFKAGVKHVFAGPSSMFGVHFGEFIPTNYRDWYKTNSELYKKFAWNLIKLGVMLEPDSREPWFICEAHQEIDLGWFEDIATKAIFKALNSTD
ncbi:aspartate aminotransferase family protein [Pigmentibacter ruber]